MYHYGAHDNGLRRLRSGDYRSLLAEATGAAPSIIEAPAVVVATSTFWRNAWRYQARAYRHVYWDLGTTLANPGGGRGGGITGAGRARVRRG